MRILIIEDNKSKLSSIKHFILQNYPEAEIHDALSYTAGLRRLYEEEWTIILLDMSLPVYDMNQQDSGGEKKSVAGKEIMKRMMHKNIIVPTIVVTQFDTFGDNGITIEMLNNEFQNNMGAIWKGTVNYEGSSWETILRQKIDEVLGR